ncbi:hypothetical protein HanIR_Chr06g0274871 [Helianthus annuus]|nr:hypothetical protein HanIR_Chr06g0274841 [Helianthus annuus]KAJ0566542.1 hypothetical protein HanIR_Chr06g0274871 [Helianthus annuus]
MRPYARPCISDKPRRSGSEPGVQLTVQGTEGKPGKERPFPIKNDRADPRSNINPEKNDQRTERATQTSERNGRAKPRTTVRDRRPVNDL